MNENVELNESPRAKPGTPGTGSAHKTGASYRNAPHLFTAHHGPDGTVLLEVQQNYTGRRQWFRFTAEDWAQVTQSDGTAEPENCEVCGGPLRAGEGDGNVCGPCTSYEIESADAATLARIESSACDGN